MENSITYSLEQKIEELKNDFENGSTVIAKKALVIFTEAIETIILSFSKPVILSLSKPVILSLSKDEFTESETTNRETQNVKNPISNKYYEIESIKDKIINAKPAMASVKKIIETAFILFQNGTHPNEILKQIQDRMTLASDIVIEKAVHHIIENDFQTIATCSYSSSVMNLFKKLKVNGYQFNVLALDSIWNCIDYSKRILDECRGNNIEAVKLNQKELINSDFDCALIGADAIIPGKGIVNGVPSKLLSEILMEKGIPLFVIAESFKKINDIHINDGFEFIAKESIEKIFSDELFY